MNKSPVDDKQITTISDEFPVAGDNKKWDN
jgi:hypothetical protein